MQNQHLTSIITPCHNAAKYIQETADSVLAQTYSNWEWLITDDCSTDDSVAIIKELCKQDNRIQLFQLKQNSGAAIARNQSLENAKGRYITFLDSDDLWKPHFLETTINYLETNKVELVYASYERVDESLQPYIEPFIVPKKIGYKRLLYNCPIPMLTSVYDSKRIGKIKIPELENREDYAMWLSVLEKIDYAHGIQEPLAIYRIRKGSFSRNKWLMAKHQFNIYFKFLKLPLHQSLFYTLSWAWNGIRKYGTI